MIELQMKPFEEQSYYELLEVPPNASDEEIREAYARAAEQLGPDSVALYSLAEPEQAEALLALLKRAVQTLTDPELRRAYDRAIGLPSADPPPTDTEDKLPSIRSRGERPVPQVHSTFPDVSVAYVDHRKPDPPRAPDEMPHPPGLSSAPRIAEEQALASAEAALANIPGRPASSPKEPRAKVEISPDAELNGETLRKIREAKGLSLAEISDRTRISKSHLENVEADRYAALPATVYLRGILMNLARELGLDSLVVSKGYLELVAKTRKG